MFKMALILIVAASLTLPGCVSRRTHNTVVAERDRLTGENARLSTELELSERQVAVLKREQQELTDDIARWTVLGAIKMLLLADGLHIILPHDVLYTSGSTTLKADGKKLVSELVAELNAQPYQIAVLGFTDNVPVGPQLARRFPSNWDLAAARAASVVRQMESEGIPPAQLVAVSRGETEPIASNDTAEGRAQNRRIDVRIRPIVN